jgi:hypothetical protein
MQSEGAERDLKWVLIPEDRVANSQKIGLRTVMAQSGHWCPLQTASRTTEPAVIYRAARAFFSASVLLTNYSVRDRTGHHW